MFFVFTNVFKAYTLTIFSLSGWPKKKILMIYLLVFIGVASAALQKARPEQIVEIYKLRQQKSVSLWDRTTNKWVVGGPSSSSGLRPIH